MAKGDTRGKGSAAGLVRLLPLLVPAGLLVATLAVPFVYETQTLWYKSGSDKTLLRLGQLVGLLAVYLLFLQLLLGARVPPLASLYGTATLLRLHQRNGLFLALLAISHATLILLAEGLLPPLAWKFWPELVGVFLLAILLLTVLLSRFREQLRLPYRPWRVFHRGVGWLALPLATVHVLFVSESFAAGLPRYLLLLLAAGVAVWLLAARLTLRRGGTAS